MTATGVPDSRAPAAAEPPGSGEQLREGSFAFVAAPEDGADVATRHRLRRALRILTAARRRDDGGGRDIDS